MSFLWPSQDDRQRELLERSRKGDRDAFRSLYLELHGPVAAFVGRRVGRREDAEDLVAKVFHRLLEQLGAFDVRRGSPRIFVLAIARNLVIDHARSARRDVPVDDLAGVLADEAGTPLEALLREEDLRDLRAALLEMPADVREMLALRFGDGLRHAEIAALLGVEVSAVKQRFSRAQRELRARLREGRRRPADSAPAASRGEGQGEGEREGGEGAVDVRW